jgi:hypothetical protein
VKTAIKTASEDRQTLPLRMLGGLRPPLNSANELRHDLRHELRHDLLTRARWRSSTVIDGWRLSVTESRFVWHFGWHREERADQIAWHFGWRWPELANHFAWHLFGVRARHHAKTRLI